MLINGCDGIGTGWSTKIPNYNPFEVINCVRWMIQGNYEEKKKENLKPFYFGFQGEIVELSPSKYISRGIVRIEDEGHRFVISELPIGTWTQDMKNRLEDLLAQNYGNSSKKNKKKNDKKKTPPRKKKKPNRKFEITGFREYHTETTVRVVRAFFIPQKYISFFIYHSRVSSKYFHSHFALEHRYISMSKFPMPQRNFWERTRKRA